MASNDRFNVTSLAEEVLRNPNPGTRKIALQGLSIYMTYQRIAELVFYVSQRDSNPEVRQAATELLASMPSRSSDIQ